MINILKELYADEPTTPAAKLMCVLFKLDIKSAKPYRGESLSTLIYASNPLLNLIPKNNSFTGKYYPVKIDIKGKQ